MTMNVDRRRFVRSALLGCIALGSHPLLPAKRKPLLSFATLGCPDWSYKQIIDFASGNGYDGIEFRGMQREFDLTKHATFSSDEAIHNAKRLARDRGIQIVCLGSSAVLHHAEKEPRRKNIEEAKRFVDLAEKLGCPFVRVFPDKYSPAISMAESQKLIADGMCELADYAGNRNITILMSTHGDVVTSEDIQAIMTKVPYRNVGIGWDILNTWYETRIPPAIVYREIRQYIKIVHVKDMHFSNGKETNVLLGKGEVPVFEGLDALLNDSYEGFLSFVWEKHWFPDIEPPEVAFADYIRVMQKYLNNRAKG